MSDETKVDKDEIIQKASEQMQKLFADHFANGKNKMFATFDSVLPDYSDTKDAVAFAPAMLIHQLNFERLTMTLACLYTLFTSDKFAKLATPIQAMIHASIQNLITTELWGRDAFLAAMDNGLRDGALMCASLTAADQTEEGH